MHTLFSDPRMHNRGVLQWSDFNNVRRGIGDELEKTISYYRKQVLNVNNDHLLVKILQSLPIHAHHSYQQLVDTAGDLSVQLNSNLRLTSAGTTGILHPTSFLYGKGTQQIIISIDDVRVVTDDHLQNWRDLQPIRLLSHPFNDLSLRNLTGHYPESDGISVVSIDIPMLLLQYRRWIETEKSMFDDADRLITQFVRMYPLNNALYSHVDVAFFNRLADVTSGGILTPYMRTHPFAMVDYTRRVDQVLITMAKMVNTRNWNMDEVIHAVPMLTRDCLADVMRLPKGANTRQISWALTVARLPLIQYLLRMNGSENKSANRFYLGKILIGLQRLQNDRWFDSVLRPSDRVVVLGQLEELKEFLL